MSHPEMKGKLWGGHLWNPSYCVVTVSDRSLAQVEAYIESQKEKPWGGTGRPPRDLERLQAYHRGIRAIYAGMLGKITKSAFVNEFGDILGNSISAVCKYTNKKCRSYDDDPLFEKMKGLFLTVVKK